MKIGWFAIITGILLPLPGLVGIIRTWNWGYNPNRWLEVIILILLVIISGLLISLGNREIKLKKKTDNKENNAIKREWVAFISGVLLLGWVIQGIVSAWNDLKYMPYVGQEWIATEFLAFVASGLLLFFGIRRIRHKAKVKQVAKKAGAESSDK